REPDILERREPGARRLAAVLEDLLLQVDRVADLRAIGVMRAVGAEGDAAIGGVVQVTTLRAAAAHYLAPLPANLRPDVVAQRLGDDDVRGDRQDHPRELRLLGQVRLAG